MQDELTSYEEQFVVAPWLGWVKHLLIEQEIPSSNLGGASLFLLSSTSSVSGVGVRATKS